MCFFTISLFSSDIPVFSSLSASIFSEIGPRDTAARKKFGILLSTRIQLGDDEVVNFEAEAGNSVHIYL